MCILCNIFSPSKIRSEEGILIDVDYGTLGYVIVACCDSICHEVFNFIQIGPGHTVDFGLFSCFNVSTLIFTAAVSLNGIP